MLGVLGLLLLLAACSAAEDSQSTPCLRDTDCPPGQTCAMNQCRLLNGPPTDGDDGGADGDDWGGECRFPQDCPPGHACINRLCIPDSLVDGDSTGDGDETPDGDGVDGDADPDGDVDREEDTGRPCKVHADCNDGLFCNGVELCGENNRCLPGSSPCTEGVSCADVSCDEERNQCNYVANNSRCSDNNACNGIETCDLARGCLPGTAPVCEDDIPCTTASCHPLDGCVFEPDDTLCDDGDPCTVDVCDPDRGGCVNAQNDAQCDDGIACTVDYCDPELGCVSEPDNSRCDDGFACTVDRCLHTGCDNQPNHDLCAPDEFCTPTASQANPTTGCVKRPQCYVDADCDDGLHCNGVERCIHQQCTPGTPVACDDSIACTQDRCDEDLKRCVYTPVNSLCADGNLCNGIETCSAQFGCQAGTPLNCDDGIACTEDRCEPLTGCVNQPFNALCDDGVSCTVDICNPATGCQNQPDNSRCDDLVPCTEDICHPVNGCSNTPNNAFCEDGIACTTATCTRQFNCVYETNHAMCNDNISCTQDTCVVGVGCTNQPDHGLCVGDMICDSGQGCISPQCTTNSHCNDGNICNGLETCVNYTCAGGVALNCAALAGGSNFNSSCHAQNGCQYTCQTNWFDCNGNLGSPTGDGCETTFYSLQLGLSHTGNSCAIGRSRMNEYSGQCPGYANGWYEQGPEVIYRWIAPSSVSDDLIVSAESQTSGFDPDVFVLTNLCNPASCIAWEGYESGGTYYAQFRPVANQTYYIVVDGYNGGCGSYRVGADWRGNTDCEQSGPAHHWTFALILAGLALWLGVLARRRRV